jgi:predicted alpha-1,2-mannosidase
MRNFYLIAVLIFFKHTTILAQGVVPIIQEASDKAQNKISKPSISTSSPSLFVNPFIGTGGHGHTFPGATAPFGMMQLNPDTRYEGWDGCSGYHYSDSIIYGFSHTHLSGTGVPDYCDLLIVPQTGKANTIPGYKSPTGYGSRFSHAKEEANPGFYKVYLEDGKIDVRLTTTERAGIHEYNFETKDEKRFILIDLDHRDEVLAASVKIKGKNAISGNRISKDWAKNQHFYFYLTSSTPFTKAKKIFKNGEHKLLLEFPKSCSQITLKVGISAVDENGAKKNLDTEIGNSNFDQVRATTVFKWNQELSKIAITTENKEQKTIFYTALYHNFLAPNLFNDVDGRYRGRDNQIHQIDKTENHYTVFSLWDTYRGTNPLYTLIQPKRTNEFIRTFLRQFNESGDLPVWELAANETECMIGYHSVSVIADAYLKGLRDYNSKEALAAMIKTTQLDEYGKIPYSEKGFISAHEEPESASKTIEYAYDDYCIASMAKALGNDSAFQIYNKRSYNFIHLFDPQTKFMRARRGAMWYGPFDPTEVNFNFTEANSWQYSLYAPQHIEDLTNLLGGKDSLELWMDELFTTDKALSGRAQSDITGLIGQYAHGNEPSHHAAYLYNFTKAPFKTQFYVDKILSELYTNTPDGLSGNEDCGQMSAWYVLSSMGFYPIAPGNPNYQIGRPLFDKVKMNLGNGKFVEIVTKNNSLKNKYVQSISWNGNPIQSNEISHLLLIKGGILEIEMSDIPSKRLETENLYPSTIPSEFVPAPFIVNDNPLFIDAAKIDISYVKLNDGSKYTLLYSFDSENWTAFQRPFTIKNSTNIYTKLQKITLDGARYESPIVVSYFHRRDPSIHLELQTKYANEYAAAGANALIDGVRGGKEFRTGDWQGFNGQDIKAIVSFDSIKTIKEIGASFIRDQKSWIFLPTAIEIEISKDGTNFQALPSISIPKASPNDENPKTFTFTTKIENEQIKAIRYTIKNPGFCPEWHLGKGNKTWVFVDELTFE